MSKRGRDAPDADLEQRVVNLIVRVGDKNISSQLHTHLEGLASALEGDINRHRKLIVETILDCAQSLHTKSQVYGTLSGLLNVADESIGRDIVEGAQRELQRALDDHAPMGIRGMTRFVVELVNASVVAPSVAVELVQLFVGMSTEDGPSARADWFCVLAMDALVLCGKTLAAESPGELDSLVSTLRAHAAKRAPLTETAPLLLPYGASTVIGTELVEHFDALYTALTTMHDDGGWSSPYLLQPCRGFASELSKGKMQSVSAFRIPAHSPGCTYPAFHRLRLSDGPTSVDVAMREASADAQGEGEAAGGRGGSGGGGVAGGGELAAADRVMIEELAFMLIHAFSLSHKDCAKLLVGMAEELMVDCSPLFAEVLLSLLLTLPSPKHKQMYYASVIIDMCKVVTSFPPALEKALNSLFGRLPRLDVHLADRLARWLGFHISHFSFSLAPFEHSWGEVLSSVAKPEDATAAATAAALDSRARFVRRTLEHSMRLSYIERVERELPSAFAPYLAPRPVGRLGWDQPGEGDLQPDSPASLSAALLGKLRTKLPASDVTAWVDNELGTHPMRTELVVHTMLHAGSKSVSHLEKLLDKYAWLLAHVAGDARGKTLVVGAACAYWQASPQMRSMLCLKLMEHHLVDPAAILSYAFSPAGRPTLVDASGWELVDDVLEWVVARQRDTAGKLRSAERRHEDASRDGLDDAAVLAAEDRVGDAKQAHEHARREKKAGFANFFAGACAVLSEADGAAGGSSFAPTEPEWRRLYVGNVHAVGRLHRNEFSIETVEMVAEGSDVPESVREEVFEPLRRLEVCMG